MDKEERQGKDRLRGVLRGVRAKLATKCCAKPQIVVVSSDETECWVCRNCKKEVRECWVCHTCKKEVPEVSGALERGADAE